MLWCTTSAPAMSRCATSSPAGCLRSSAIDRLPRWQPKNGLPAMRMLSPTTGSILITSAPRSLRIIGPNGPARYWPKSSTWMPSSACPLPLASSSRPERRSAATVFRRVPVLGMWRTGTSALRSRRAGAGDELRDRGRVVAEPAENLGGVLADLGLRPADLAGRAEHVDRHADLCGLAVHGIVDRGDHCSRSSAGAPASRAARAPVRPRDRLQLGDKGLAIVLDELGPSPRVELLPLFRGQRHERERIGVSSSPRMSSTLLVGVSPLITDRWMNWRLAHSKIICWWMPGG